jgi:hypothetical protein
MSTPVDLRQMSVPDKLRLMEELWRDLSQNESDLASPEWHGAVLAERERRLASGEDRLEDWDTAKRELRAKLECFGRDFPQY